jgi:hypothetical protein
VRGQRLAAIRSSNSTVDHWQKRTTAVEATFDFNHAAGRAFLSARLAPSLNTLSGTLMRSARLGVRWRVMLAGRRADPRQVNDQSARLRAAIRLVVLLRRSERC